MSLSSRSLLPALLPIAPPPGPAPPAPTPALFGTLFSVAMGILQVWSGQAETNLSTDAAHCRASQKGIALLPLLRLALEYLSGAAGRSVRAYAPRCGGAFVKVTLGLGQILDPSSTAEAVLSALLHQSLS